MNVIVAAVRQYVQRNWLVLPFLFIFLLLLARNPFSERTLIPNLEPYPDSFHYIDSSFSFLSGKGFVIEREGRVIEPSVPPLYSLVLAPMFFLIPDVRAFYFTNVVLAITSFFLFYTIIVTLFSKKTIQFLLLTLYVTCATLTWFPSLAMAENLLLLLFLEAILLLVSPLKPRRIILAGFVSVAFYATKYASLPLSFSFPLLFALKIFVDGVKDQKVRVNFESIQKIILKQRKQWILYAVSLFVFGTILFVYEYIVEGNTIVGRLFNLFVHVFFPKPAVPQTGDGGSTASSDGGNVFFSTIFIEKNLTTYGKWLLGDSITILWKQVVILPKILAFPSMFGFFGVLTQTKHRWASFFVLSMLACVLAFMSVFYTTDGRYFFIAIPSLFLGLGFFCSYMFELFEKRSKLISFLILLVSCIWIMSVAMQLKFSIMLNLRYAETPWYYVSVRTVDQYLANTKNEFAKTPIVISALPPYLIDAYAKEKFIILPLHKDQEFRSYPKQAWGDNDFEHLDDVYTDFIMKGHPVFLTKYGLGNEQYLLQNFDRLLQHFNAKKVKEACFGLCDIYLLSIKDQATGSAQVKGKKQ